MIDQPTPPRTTGGETTVHAAYYERRACTLAQLATQALGLGQIGWWKLWTIEAHTASQIARRIRARLALTRTPMHAADCPIARLPDCQTCQRLPDRDLIIDSTARHLGRRASFDVSIAEVVRWLQAQDAPSWRYAESERMIELAAQLIHLRDAVEAGKWGTDR